MQMISSISGAVLDSWVLTKPANFNPDLAGRTAFVQNWTPVYVPSTYLETTGGNCPYPLLQTRPLEGVSILIGGPHGLQPLP
jgi:hypothetical protein